MRSPTERTLRHLRRSGYVCQVTEVWIEHRWAPPGANGKRPGNRRDLFGFVDVLAVGHGQTLAVQCTSVSNMSGHYRKLLGQEPITEADPKKREKAIARAADRRRAVKECIDSGWTVVIWGFDKGMKAPKIRYVNESDLVDQALLTL